EHALLKLLSRWRAEAEKKGHRITRIAVAFEAGHDGFWLARWLAAQGIEAHVIHPSSVAVTREHRRAKTDRLRHGLLKLGLLWWAARRARPWKVGGAPAAGGGGRQAAEPGPRDAGWRGEPDYHSGQGGVRAARHSPLQPEAQDGCRGPRSLTHARG